MVRTVCIKLNVTEPQTAALRALQDAYRTGCNTLIPIVQAHRCWNRVALHRLAYRMLRDTTPLGSQMACNTIFSVCKAYKALAKRRRWTKDTAIPAIRFRKPSIHYDHRTYTLRETALSLYTLDGRITVQMVLGDYQRQLLSSGSFKEAELVRIQDQWFFHLVIQSPDPSLHSVTSPITVEGVDVGEHFLAATSLGQLFGGGPLRHRRDQFLALRRRLQSNGSQSAKQTLRQVSGKERRRVTHINHGTSKAIVSEAQCTGVTHLILEDLTDIRARINAGSRVRTRLHRWAFRQLQDQIAYKAQAVGLTVVYVNPAYTSQTCSACQQIGTRQGARFTCSCGFRAHADWNASRNLARIGADRLASRAAVNPPLVA